MADDFLSQARKAGYSDDEIKKYLQGSDFWTQAKKEGYSDDEIFQHFGLENAPQERSLIGKAGHMAGVIGQGLLHGAVSTLGIPGDIEALGNKYLPTWMTQPASTTLGFGDEQKAPQLFGTSSELVGDVKNLQSALGLDVEPEGKVEELASGIAQGTGANLPAILMGVPPGETIATGLAGGTGATIAHEEMPESTIAPIIGGLIGGVGAEGALGSLAARSLGKLTTAAEGELALKNAVVDSAQEAVDNFKQQKIDLGIAKQEMALDHTRELQEALAKHSETVDLLKEAAKKEIETNTGAAQQEIAKQAQSLGGSETLQQAGQALQQGAQNWLQKTFPQKKADLWNPVDALVPEDTDVGLKNFENALKDINSSAGTLEPLAAQMKNPLPKRMQSALEGIRAAQQEGLAGPITWADARKLRTTLGDAMGNPMVVRDVGQQNLARMYATLTADLRDAARTQGDDALAAFDKANQETTKLFDIAQGPIAKLVTSPNSLSGENPNPEAIAQLLLNGGKKGATDIATLKGEIPDAINELGAVAIKNGAWQKLSPEAKSQFIADAQARSALDNHFNTIDTAETTANDTLNNGIKNSLDQLNKLKEAQKNARMGHAEKVIENANGLNEANQTLKIAKANASDAEAALGALKSKAKGGSGMTLGRAGGMIGGDLLGEQIGNLLGHAIGMPEILPPAMSVAGAVLPFAYGTGSNLLKHPEVLQDPILGMLAGNALAAGGQEKAKGKE